ncbi:hypothetical protein HYV11_03035 [Candidatus Dependentiae bacterium]|nr:hypothetical protein [Candidatus Dependentiae bacterium]
MLPSLIHYFYPLIKKSEIKKFTLLSIAFMFTVGSYWIMRLLKDVVLYKLAFPQSLGWECDTGRLWIPTIKTISPFFVLVLVLLYSKLVDIFEKHKLIYIVASFYMVIFSLLSVILYFKHHYGDDFLGKHLLAISGIIGYLFTESFGSLVVALFWSFTISSSTTDQAKHAFPFIIAIGQFGAIIGSSLMLINTKIIWPFYAIVVICLGLLILTIRYLVATTTKQNLQSDIIEKKTKSNILNGFKLLFTQPYLIGVFVVSTFYEIAGTIIEYQMNSQASIMFDDTTFKWFKGIYGVSINTIACLMALFGTSYLINRFGTRICLLIYPIAFAIALILLYAYYTQSPSATNLLWATFLVMLIVKASSYAVNNPVKEIMYIPTNKDVRFKTKSIIDMYGSRSAKMSGARISGYLNVPNNIPLSIHNLMFYGTLISLGIIGIWIFAAIYVGKKNKYLVDTHHIIE